MSSTLSAYIHIVAMQSHDPRYNTNNIRYLAHGDYHCQTTTQIVEARQYKSRLAAVKAAEKFNLEYANKTNEAARFHSNIYGEAVPFMLPRQSSKEPTDEIQTFAKTPWQSRVTRLWYNLAQGQRPTQTTNTEDQP